MRNVVLLIVITSMFACFGDTEILDQTNAVSLVRVKYETNKHLYKTIDDVELFLTFYTPENEVELLPTVIFFFGGGWQVGTDNQFKTHCEFLAKRGIIGVTAQYRIKSKHGTSPLDAIEDAKSAVRWLKINGREFGIDPKRIYASGGSAGGHLAASTALIDDFNPNTNESMIDSKPCGLILFNPVLDTSTFSERFDSKQSAFNASPINFIDDNVPPTIIFHGENDHVVSVKSIIEFQNRMIQKGNYCEVRIFPDLEHGFFNRWENNGIEYEKTLISMERFIRYSL
jgi:acetyl esterase/lipase